MQKFTITVTGEAKEGSVVLALANAVKRLADCVDEGCVLSIEPFPRAMLESFDVHTFRALDIVKEDMR